MSTLRQFSQDWEAIKETTKNWKQPIIEIKASMDKLEVDRIPMPSFMNIENHLTNKLISVLTEIEEFETPNFTD